MEYPVDIFHVFLSNSNYINYKSIFYNFQ